MKRKALITGALPHPFEGPWVVLDKDRDWEIEGLREGVRVERVDGRARAILDPIKPLDTSRISVIAVEVAA